jgi:hypothetical protein
VPRRNTYETNQIAYGLELIGDEFELFPLPGVNSPTERSDWSKFLLAHPQFVDSCIYQGLASLLTERESFEGLDEGLKQLGASLIHLTFTEKELKEIAGI